MYLLLESNYGGANMAKKEYRINVELPLEDTLYLKKDECSVSVCERQTDGWLCIGMLKIDKKEPFILTKNGHWTKFSNLTEDVHIFRETWRIQHFIHAILELLKWLEFWNLSSLPMQMKSVELSFEE